MKNFYDGKLLITYQVVTGIVKTVVATRFA